LRSLRQLASLLAAGLLPVVTSVPALEVDCVACNYGAGKPDLLVELNARIARHLAAGHSAAVIADQEGGQGLVSSPIQEWASRHPAAKKPAAQLIKYRGSHLPHTHLFTAYVPCVTVNGVCLGTDKLGHFFQQGWEYYWIAVVDGKGDRVAERYGEWLEGLEERATYAAEESYFRRQLSGSKVGYGGFGRELSGVISPADLAANRAGLRFYRDLIAGRFRDIATYITPDFCEENNPNRYTRAMRAIVERNGRLTPRPKPGPVALDLPQLPPPALCSPRWEKSYQFIPNLLGDLAESPLGLSAYTQLNGLIKGSSTLSPQEQQAAMLAVSGENNCGYCIGAKKSSPLRKSLSDCGLKRRMMCRDQSIGSK
jgi:hypothetical protein